MQRIALVGLGAMGSGMAANWLKKGFALSVYNRSREKAEPLIAQGARVTETPRDAAAGADIVLSVVADNNASRAVWLGERGVLASAKPGAVLIESSTLTPDWVRELADKARAQGCDFLDAPLGGSKPAAAAGQLVFFVGGEAAALDRARPALEAVGAKINHLGAVGAGATWKLINNMMVAVEVSLLAEALVLAEKAGFDVNQAGDLIASAGVASPVIQTKVPRMVEQRFGDTDFALRHMLKDADYAIALGKRVGMSLALLPVAANLFRLGEAKGLGSDDLAAVVKAVRS
jgi:3-hydroxyisobutyrate dehydrogenase